MKKILLSSLLLAFLVGASPALADSAVAPISAYQPVTTGAIATSEYDRLVSQIVVSVLKIFDWKNNDGQIAFSDTNYSVRYDCNTIFGLYSINGKKVYLSTPGMTMMACPEKAMAADRKLVDDLSRITTLTFKEGKLIMTGRNTELSFTARLPETK